MDRIKNFIAGEYVEPQNDNWIDNHNPATGLQYAQVANSSKEDLDRAIFGAEKAFIVWSGYEIGERSQILLRLANLIDDNLDEFAKAESIDSGKPIKLAREIEIPRAASNFRFFANAIVNDHSEAYLSHQAINYSSRKPLGIVGCISPWNLPLYLFSWKIAPALATGNCVIAKPSELTPKTASMLGALANEAGLPKGVLNILQGLGGEIGQAIVEHPKVKAISFTGGTETGKKVAMTCAGQFKKASLELGGKNPNIIFGDCDLEMAVTTSVRSSFQNQGEICLCGSRIIVESAIYEEFKEGFLAAVEGLNIGDPLDSKTNFGALISADHVEKVQSYVELAKEEGGNILTGGKKIGRAGYFFEPTVIENLGPDCRVNQEEIFGPVVTLQAFNTDLEALELANATNYGLASTLWTKNITRAHKMADKLESGIVWINTWMMRDLRTPFGGVKNSGVGREGGTDALRFFVETKNVCIGQ